MVETVQRGQVGERCGGRMMGRPNDWDMVMPQASPKDQTSANGVILEQGCTAELGGNRCLSGLHRDRQQPWLAVC